ncbi:hypothetical protein G7046_g3231 [Stylonectria norvegica]|nr:hypothetical protein G7046_g3231 [Stylonectria norvegica]
MSMSLSPGAHQSPSSVSPAARSDAVDQTRRMRRKRKADTQDNERLSKRLSLLNIGILFPRARSLVAQAHVSSSEQGGSKLYVPVETPSADVNPMTTTSAAAVDATAVAHQDASYRDTDTMQVDDSKHKVYIYNMDDELSSDSDAEDGKLVFLPDIEKHLRATRIPPSILANKDGELAGMQLVLYSDPKSLTVPEEKDSVRKAIIESRHRARERLEREAMTETETDVTANVSRNGQVEATDMDMPFEEDDDPDAMDMD